jgi:hypothetical protein
MRMPVSESAPGDTMNPLDDFIRTGADGSRRH